MAYGAALFPCAAFRNKRKSCAAAQQKSPAPTGGRTGRRHHGPAGPTRTHDTTDSSENTARNPGATPMQTLIVFSHLRWNFVYQRPQHLLSRLAKRWRLVFFEEPMTGEAEQ